MTELVKQLVGEIEHLAMNSWINVNDRKPDPNKDTIIEIASEFNGRVYPEVCVPMNVEGEYFYHTADYAYWKRDFVMWREIRLPKVT